MFKSHKKFIISGFGLIFLLMFVYFFYEIKYKPYIPQPPKEKIRITCSDSTKFYRAFLYDFENIPTAPFASRETSYKGNISIRSTGYYSPVIQKPLAEVEYFRSVSFGLWLKSGDLNKPVKGKLMFQITDKYNRLKYSKAVDVGYDVPVGKDWTYICGKADMNDYQFCSEDLIKFYFRNEKKIPIFFDEAIMIFYD